MASGANSSASAEDLTHQNPNSNPHDIAERCVGSLTLNDYDGVVVGGVALNHERSGVVPNGLLNGDYDRRDGSGAEEELQGGMFPVVGAREVVEEVLEGSSSGVVWRNNSEGEGDPPSSPSSSGYAGERGSSSGTSASGIREVDEDEVDGAVFTPDNDVDPASDLASRVPGKRHMDEDDGSISWRKRKKHFFVLSNSGKPIYSRYGDEHKLAGFSATLQAIISFVENGGDRVKFVRAGKHQVVFLVKGPIYLVCISCTEEPSEALRGQLELIYGQMLLILTKSVNRCFEKNPKFDMTPLLGGTDVVFSSLIHSFSWFVHLPDLFEL